ASPCVRVESADEPPVEYRDAVAGQEQDVPGMQVGVKEPVAEDHSGDELQALPCDHRRVVADRADAVVLDAVDELHRQHAIAAELLDGRGNDERRVAVEVLAELASVVGLDAEIELLVDRL